MNLLDLFLPKKSKVEINGNSYTGKNFTITDETITIDGQTISTSKIPAIDIKVYGDVGLLDLKAGKVTIEGTATEVKTVSGDVVCDNAGKIETVSGDVECKTIHGSVSTISGDISL